MKKNKTTGNKNKKIVIIIVAMVLICLLYAVISTIFSSVGYEVVDGQVTAINESSSNYNYKVTVEFEYDSETYSFIERTDDFIAYGSSVTVRFESGYPSNAEIYEQNYVLDLFTYFFNAAMIMGCCAFIVYIFYSSSRRTRVHVPHHRAPKPEEMTDIFGEDYVPRRDIIDIFGYEYSDVNHNKNKAESVVEKDSEVVSKASEKMHVDTDSFNCGTTTNYVEQEPFSNWVSDDTVSTPQETTVEAVKIDDAKMKELLEKDIYKNPYETSTSADSYSYDGYGKAEEESRFGDDGYYGDDGYGKDEDDKTNSD